jgi:hypothetical protein
MQRGKVLGPSSVSVAGPMVEWCPVARLATSAFTQNLTRTQAGRFPDGSRTRPDHKPACIDILVNNPLPKQ